MNLNNHDRRAFLRRSATLSMATALAASPRVMRAQSSQDAAGTPVVLEGTDTAGQPVDVANLENRQGEYAEVNGARIFYQVSGEGEPMLLLHGFPLSGAMFDRNRAALSAQFQVITVDHRGYGLSETPEIPDAITTYAEDALAVLDELGIEQAIVGGHSMGGPITLEMFKQAPDRFRGMMLIDTNAAAATPAEVGLELGLADMVEQNGVQAIIPAFMAEFLTGETRLNQPDLVSYLTTIMEAASKEAAIGGLNALASRPDYTDLLSNIEVPALVLVGLEDSLYPYAISMMMNQAIPTSELVMISGAAHAANFEAPERASQAILDWAAGIM